MWLGSVAQGVIGVVYWHGCFVVVNITVAAETRKRDLGERLRPSSERLMHLVGELPVVDATVFFLGQSGSQNLLLCQLECFDC